MKVHILDDWSDTLRTLPCFARMAGHEVTVWTDAAEGAELAARLQGAEAVCLFRERTRITAGLLDALPDLRLISGRGAWPHVDVEACAARGVAFASRKPDEAPNHAAAELTWALILAALRDLRGQMASAKAGLWQAGVGRTLRGKTIGIYGHGRIGRLIAGYAAAFGASVLWWGSEAGRARAAAEGGEVPQSRAAFFARSDVVTLHLRLTPQTIDIVTADDLAQMGPRSVLVNTSRAGLIAPGALLAALDCGRPGMAALDVFDTEPLTDPADPLLSHPRVIATPHIGFVTEEEFDLQFADVFDQVNAFAAGQPIHLVTP
ncbi:D-2-hydroxyacid dehydrogenase family protein [Pseudotabrizicola algicola]|uniref:D-2-hydroxyacid dehydrogenase family protein n=1 Tax=Pseudotabrizicola algicola TaxID=2709381 RepID=A0A6B3RM94_9RHOB|nr:D-2-hydroxyacid dehydrogenase family protein [Pseudotabrizicola algicola]NEX46581.1 D-2-hydroxyacid dehydrogenase family protein [Pseudotabrizicola algicola]